MHLYELLCHVYSGSMEHRDLEGLSKGISHIVTFSWNRRAQIEDEWQGREQMRMRLRRREQFLLSAGLRHQSTLIHPFFGKKNFVLLTTSLVQGRSLRTQQDLKTETLYHIRIAAERFSAFWLSLYQPQSDWPGFSPRGTVTTLSFTGDNDKTSGMLMICAMNMDMCQINDPNLPHKASNVQKCWF